MKQIIGIILSILIFSGNLFADKQKHIQVKFTISEPQYINFYESEIRLIEQQCASRMADSLNQLFRFFHFQVEDCQSVLHIKLADREQQSGSHSSLKEVGFKVRIIQNGNQNITEPVYWIFRPVERYIESLPDVRDEFIEEIIQTFYIGVQSIKEDLVKNILSQVEVTDDFYFINDDKPMYILPLADKENNIAKFSRFLIITSVPDDVFGTKESYDTTIVKYSIKNIENAIRKYQIPVYYPVGSLALEKLFDDTDEIPVELLNTEEVDKKIYILKYTPLTDSRLEIISPENISSNSNTDQ